MMKTYQSPLTGRYDSEMSYLFSMENKVRTWRRLWIILAECEKALGVPITDEEINDLRKYETKINWKLARKIEKEVNHDVVAHIRTYGHQAKKASRIIHLGATSCYVSDNADLIIMKDGLKIIKTKLQKVINSLKKFSLRHKNVITAGYTHGQTAQPITVGKRSCIWMQDFMMDLKEINRRIDELPFLGAKGATGTATSFVCLLGSEKLAQKLDEMIRKKVGFKYGLKISGQTYTRKIDYNIMSALSGIGQSAGKFANDIRLLAAFGEMSEAFGKKQVGSSAMPYKKNPLTCERVCSLSRFLIGCPSQIANTVSTQWLERSLDDSAIRRIVIPESFMAAGIILDLADKIINGLQLNREIIIEKLAGKSHEMLCEALLIEGVKRGGDRQQLHEIIRMYAMNDRLGDIKDSLSFKDIDIKHLLVNTLDMMTGMAESQVEDFCKGV